MTLKELFGMESETGTLINPPNIQVMMTGVKLAMIEPSGRTTLLYTDGQTETAILPTPAPVEFFKLVGDVQAKARNSKAKGAA